MLKFCNISVCSVGEKSLYTHTVCTQNQLTVVQHSSHRFHSLFPNENDMVMIIRTSSAMARDHMKKALKVRPYCLSWMKCQMLTWICTMTHAVCHSKVLFSDECAIYHSASNRCVVFWSMENPLFLQELVHAALAMTLRLSAWTVLFWWFREHDESELAFLGERLLINKIFVLKKIKNASFKTVLEMWLNLWLRNRGLRWWETSTPHSFCVPCSERTLSRLLYCPWFTDTLAPITWPPYIPDLITMYRPLWGSIKGSVAACHYATIADLFRAVEFAFHTVTQPILWHISQRICRRFSLCVQHQGAHSYLLEV
jgi:hypothetical protein